MADRTDEQLGHIEAPTGAKCEAGCCLYTLPVLDSWPQHVQQYSIRPLKRNRDVGFKLDNKFEKIWTVH